ncbi:MAG: 50S ribosomal protein L25 [Acidimicrobiales bacterium]
MAETILIAETGRETGSRSSRRLRREGKIPGVLYGREVGPYALHVDAKELRTVLQGEAGLNALMRLEVDGKPYITMAKDIQRHPVKGTVIHVDFEVTDPDKTVAVEVPLALTGHASHLQMAGGIVDQQLFSVTVVALPGFIPHTLELDITSLTAGGALRVADIAVPSGVEVENDPDALVVAGIVPKGVHDVSAEGGEGELELGGEGEPNASGSDSSDR